MAFSVGRWILFQKYAVVRLWGIQTSCQYLFCSGLDLFYNLLFNQLDDVSLDTKLTTLQVAAANKKTIILEVD